MTRRFVRSIALASGLALLAVACASDSTEAPTAEPGPAAGPGADAAEGTSSLGFTAPVLFGGELDASSLVSNGEPTVLWFWAPWCTTCRSEAPNVVAAAAAYEGEVQVIGVAGRGEVPAMERFVQDTSTESLVHVVDADGSIWSDFEVFAQPAFAFLNDAGEIQEVFVGVLGEKALNERLATLIDA